MGGQALPLKSSELLLYHMQNVDLATRSTGRVRSGWHSRFAPWDKRCNFVSLCYFHSVVPPTRINRPGFQSTLSEQLKDKSLNSVFTQRSLIRLQIVSKYKVLFELSETTGLELKTKISFSAHNAFPERLEKEVEERGGTGRMNYIFYLS